MQKCYNKAYTVQVICATCTTVLSMLVMILAPFSSINPGISMRCYGEDILLPSSSAAGMT